MRILAIAIVALFAAAGPAAAQQDIAREIERKGRAGEQDGGFCGRAMPRLAKFTRDQLAERLHTLLARPDQNRASLVFVVTDRPDGEPACTYFAFEPVTTRDGKKRRPARVFVCIAGRDCRSDFDHAICEQRPGKWG